MTVPRTSDKLLVLVLSIEHHSNMKFSDITGTVMQYFLAGKRFVSNGPLRKKMK